jgi:hypothetical protein
VVGGKQFRGLFFEGGKKFGMTASFSDFRSLILYGEEAQMHSSGGVLSRLQSGNGKKGVVSDPFRF